MMFSSHLRMNIALDWSAEVLTWGEGDRIYSSPNVVLLKPGSEEPVVGEKVRGLLLAHPELSPLRPPPGHLFGNTLAITRQLEEIFAALSAKAPLAKRILLPKVFVALPVDLSEFEIRGFAALVRPLASQFILCEAPFVAAIGARIPVQEKKHHGILVCDSEFLQFGITYASSLFLAFSLRRGTKTHEESLGDFAELLAQKLAKLPEDVREDLLASPILIAGPHASRPDIADFFAEKTSFRFRPAQNPGQCAVRGLLEMLPSMDQAFKEVSS